MALQLRNLLREPLLHFLLIGALLFVAYAVVSKPDGSEPGTIVVTPGHIASMRAVYERTWQRPPTEVDLKGLIDSYVREEVLYREGLAMGLDRDDPMIRRRVRQKVDLLSEEALATEPTERELQAYLAANRTKFAAEPVYTMRQVFIDPTRPGRNLERAMSRLMAELKRAGDTDQALRYGDTTMLPHRLEATPAAELSNIFGEEFPKELAAVAPGQWLGPIRSGYGLHFVFVSEKRDGHATGLEANRELVRREWERDQRVAAAEKFYQRLLQRYTVTVEETKLAQTASPAAKTQ